MATLDHEVLENYTTQAIPINLIYSDADFNCRQEKIIPFDVTELAEDIQRHGLTQPIVVRPYDQVKKFQYQVIVGHRRLQAFKNLKRDTIPAIVRPDIDEAQARVLNLSENIQRKNLNVYQESKAIEYFFLKGWTYQEVAEKLQVSMGWVQVRATVLQLPYEIQKEIAAGLINQTQIKDIYSLRDRDKMFEAVRYIKDKKLKDSKRAIVVKKPEKKKKGTDRKLQSLYTLAKMQDFIMDLLGPSLTTRVLAWAGGHISNQDLLDDISEECSLRNVQYKKPDWIE